MGRTLPICVYSLLGPLQEPSGLEAAVCLIFWRETEAQRGCALTSQASHTSVAQRRLKEVGTCGPGKPAHGCEICEWMY